MAKLSPVKYLITGGAGFIGSHLVELLLSEGIKPQQIRILIQPGESTNNLPPKPFEFVVGDIKEWPTIRQISQNVNVCYHLAARTIDGNPYNDYLEVNAISTKRLLNCLKKQPLKKFIFFSSIAVYGLPAYTGPLININENSPKNPGEIYGQSKLEGEKIILKAHQRWGLPYAIIRPTSVYGPRDIRNLFELYKIINKHLFILIGDGHNKMDYVYVKDLVKGARLAELSPDVANDYIIGGHKTLTLRQVANTVASSLKTTIPYIYLPKLIALPISHLAQSLFSLVGRRSPLFPDRVKVMTSDCYFNISKAKHLLKYQPQYTFRHGTKITAQWLSENGVIK